MSLNIEIFLQKEKSGLLRHFFIGSEENKTLTGEYIFYEIQIFVCCKLFYS